MEITAIFDNLDKISFIQPGWLWMFLIIPIIFLSQVLTPAGLSFLSPAKYFNTEIEDSNVYFHPFAKELTNTITRNSRKSYFTLVLLVPLSLLILALTQPVIRTEKIPEPVQERDIVFIIDTSVSMILKDYELNGEPIDRMSVLKAVLQNFISRLQGDKMSLIVFGDHAYTLLPLTSDQQLLKTMVSRIETTMAGRFNAIGDAISLGIYQSNKPVTGIPANHVNASIDKPRKKILVLLTDADQPTSQISPELAAELAREQGLPIYSIAIGATAKQEVNRKPGSLIYSPVDISLLEKISGITSGQVFRAKDVTDLEHAIEAISRHESNLSKQIPRYYNKPLYHYLIILAVAIFTLHQLIIFLFSTLRLSLHKKEKINA